MWLEFYLHGNKHCAFYYTMTNQFEITISILGMKQNKVFDTLTEIESFIYNNDIQETFKE